jgi:hypothetical protein
MTRTTIEAHSATLTPRLAVNDDPLRADVSHMSHMTQPMWDAKIGSKSAKSLSVSHWSHMSHTKRYREENASAFSCSSNKILNRPSTGGTCGTSGTSPVKTRTYVDLFRPTLENPSGTCGTDEGQTSTHLDLQPGSVTAGNHR